MNNLEILGKIIEKNELGESVPVILNNLVNLVTAHNEAISEILAASNKITTNPAVIECPNCKMHTMLGLMDCHICGESLFTNEEETTKKVEKVTKKETKKKEIPVKEDKVKEEEEIVSDEDLKNEFDDDEDLDDIKEEPLKKKVTKKTTKKKTKKQLEKEAKEKETEDDDFGLEDDPEINTLLEEKEESIEDFDLDDEDFDLELD